MSLSPRPLLSRLRNRLLAWAERRRQRVRSELFRQAHLGLPIPPSRLIYLVSGTEDAEWFLAGGRRAADSVLNALSLGGIDPYSLRSVLDFGCGVGRVLRHFEPLALRGVALHGTDYNPRLIAWCRQNLPFARFSQNRLEPGLDHPAASFDLIYAFSVFTHLNPENQSAWMSELFRLVRPGGHLLISLHGLHYLRILSEGDRARFESGSMVVLGSSREGRNDCASFHPESYVRSTLARDWQIAAFIPEGAWGNPSQDLYLLRKPAQPLSAVA